MRTGLLHGLLAALTWAAVGCVPTVPSPATGGAAPAPRGLVRIAWDDVGPPTPFRVSTAGPGGPVLLTLLYDTLTWKDEQGIIPWLATRWEVSPDGRDYTFDLAPAARWQDGQPLTAADVAFSFEYYARFPYRWVSTAMVESAQALAPDRVTVRLREPFAPFLEEVAGGLPILPRHVWQGVADPTRYVEPDGSLGSGPYTLAEYRPAEGAYRLRANPTYFRGPVLVQEVQQLATPAETRLQAVQQGQLELTFTTDASVVDLLRDQSRVRVLETPPLSVVRLALNTERAPLDRQEVRQALAYALDRARIGRLVTKGTPVPGSPGLVPPETPWFNPRVRTYPFDPSRARALLNGQSLALELLADPSNREPELLEPMLRDVGITLTTRRVDGKTRTQLLREKRFQLAQLQHIGVGGDPDFLRRWYTGEEANDYAQGSVFRDPAFEQLARQQAETQDPATRKALLDRMQEILAEQLPTIPLYYRRFYWLYDSSRYTPMNTWGGLMNGIPLVYNKLSFLRR